MKIDVLLVEDNRADVIMLAEAVRQAGLDYCLYRAWDGQVALDLLDRRASDSLPRLAMIVVDLNLPRVDGFELLGKLRNRPDCRDVPTVILTTSAWEDRAGKLEGFDREAFFQKPSFLEDWIAIMQAIEAYRHNQSAAIPPPA